MSYSALILIIGIFLLLIFLRYSQTTEHLSIPQCSDITDEATCNNTKDDSGNRLCSYCMCGSQDNEGNVTCINQCVPYGKQCGDIKNNGLSCYTPDNKQCSLDYPPGYINPSQCYTIDDPEACNQVVNDDGSNVCSYCTCVSYYDNGDPSCDKKCVPYAESCGKAMNQRDDLNKNSKCYDQGGSDDPDSLCKCASDNPGASSGADCP